MWVNKHPNLAIHQKAVVWQPSQDPISGHQEPSGVQAALKARQAVPKYPRIHLVKSDQDGEWYIGRGVKAVELNEREQGENEPSHQGREH